MCRGFLCLELLCSLLVVVFQCFGSPHCAVIERELSEHPVRLRAHRVAVAVAHPRLRAVAVQRHVPLPRGLEVVVPLAEAV